MDIRVVLVVLASTIGFLIFLGAATKSVPAPAAVKVDPGYVLVQRCKPPLFRAVREYVVRDNEGHMFLVDGAKNKTLIADNVPLRKVCKGL